MSDSDDDPLNVGNVVSAPVKSIPVTEQRVIRASESTSSTSLLALSQEEPRRRRFKTMSLKGISKFFQQEFDLEMPASSDRKMTQSLASLPDLVSLSKPVTDEIVDFKRFVVPEQLNTFSEALKGTRRALFATYVNETRKIVADLKARLNNCLEQRSQQMKNCEAVIRKLQSLHRMGAESQRKNAAIIIIAHRKQGRIEKLMGHKLQNDIERTVMFFEFLRDIESNGKYPLLPAIDVAAFRKSLETVDEKIERLSREVKLLMSKAKELVELKPGTGDWYFNLMHPKSKTGQIIQRFEEKVGELTYEDVYHIIGHLSENEDDFSRLEDLLFDLGWQKQPFPFGFARMCKLPTKGDFFPAVVGDTLVDEEFAFIPFNVLNGMDWPFKSAVDMIFDMLILTNPFRIARVYWDVIQEAAQCMQKVLVNRGKDPDEIEIDFDSLFPILMICVFAFGSDEWMRVALYTISFNEQVDDDPQLQFAMTYLEGLITHIMALDKAKLRQKSIEMRGKWADEQSDPLGVK